MAELVWTTSANDGQWDTVANWSLPIGDPSRIPIDGDDVTIAGTHPPTAGPAVIVTLHSLDTTGCTVAFDPAGAVTSTVNVSGGACLIGRTGVTGNHWAGDASDSVGSIYWNTDIDGHGGNGFIANGNTTDFGGTSGSTFNNTSDAARNAVNCTFNGSSTSESSVSGTATYNGASGPVNGGTLTGTIEWNSSATIDATEVTLNGTFNIHANLAISNVAGTFGASFAFGTVAAGKSVSINFGNFTLVYPTPSGGAGGTSRLSLSL